MHLPPDLAAYRARPSEQHRVSDLFDLTPASGRAALDIGARDGHLSRLLARRFDRVTALDLEQPDIDDPKVECVQGDASRLTFADNSFDMVLCAEVLEHIPATLLPAVCSEITRVCNHTVVIGVPFRQDIRHGRTLCPQCGQRNPPWGHVNSFDEADLARLFPGLTPMQTRFVGATREVTNTISAALMDFAGNPFGTYGQDEGCIACGATLKPPTTRSPLQRVATRSAVLLTHLQQRFTPARGNWLHVQFRKAVAE